jgi:iron complex transport system ATP-binding protein
MTITASPAATVSAVRVALGGNTILDDVTLQVRHGEVLALVGPNGAGKSTLLGVLAGDLAVSAGEVHLDGQPLRSLPARQAARQRAVLLQDVTMSFPFTVHEIVTMGRAPWRGTPAEDADTAAVTEAMRQTDVTHLARRTFNTLSGGERGRVALARVLAQRAGVLLLDEPTAALDIHHQELVLEVARARARQGDAVVIVMHDLNLAAAHADRVAVMSFGQIAADGAPAEVLTSRLLSDVYSHPVEVVPHPSSDIPIILPARPATEAIRGR